MTKKIFSKPQAVIGLVLIVIVVICAIFAPVIAPNSPDQIDPSLKYLKADWDYPLGTDQLGRCELSRSYIWCKICYRNEYSYVADTRNPGTYYRNV